MYAAFLPILFFPVSFHIHYHIYVHSKAGSYVFSLGETDGLWNHHIFGSGDLRCKCFTNRLYYCIIS